MDRWKTFPRWAVNGISLNIIRREGGRNEERRFAVEDNRQEEGEVTKPSPGTILEAESIFPNENGRLKGKACVDCFRERERE